MATYIKNHMNKTLKLSQHITNPEVQFSNGYLICEVLLISKLLSSSDFNDTVINCDGKDNDDDEVQVLHNFKVIYECMKVNNVNYERKLLQLIMVESRGAAVNLLLCIKNHCESSSSSSPSSSPSSKQKHPYKQLKSTTSIRPKQFTRAPLTTWGLDDFYTTTANSNPLAPLSFNALDSLAQLSKFHGVQRSHERGQSRIEDEVMSGNNENTKNRIREHLTKSRDRSAFMTALIASGRKTWEVNEGRRVERDRQLLRYELAILATRDVKERNCRVKFGKEGKDGVNDFEVNLRRLGVGGGNDGSGDDGSTLTLTLVEEGSGKYENFQTYEQRLFDTVTDQIGPPGENENPKSGSNNHEYMTSLRKKEALTRNTLKEKNTRQRKNKVDLTLSQAELDRDNQRGMFLEGLIVKSRGLRDDAHGVWVRLKDKALQSAIAETRVGEMKVKRVEGAEREIEGYFNDVRVVLGEEGNKIQMAKEERLGEIGRIKEEAKKRKRGSAEACVGDAVGKLVDLVWVVCCERERLGLPSITLTSSSPSSSSSSLAKLELGLSKTYTTQVYKRYTSPRPFYPLPPPNANKDANKHKSEENFAAAYAEEVCLMNGRGFYTGFEGDDFTTDTDIDTDTEESIRIRIPTSDSSPEYTQNLQNELALLTRAYKTLTLHTSSTLFSYAQYIRTPSPQWDLICNQYKGVILGMDTGNGSDLNGVREVVERLEEALGDVNEGRSGRMRDICDGTISKCVEVIEGVRERRVEGLKRICWEVVENAVACVRGVEEGGVRRKVEKKRIKREAQQQVSENSRSEALRITKESEEEERRIQTIMNDPKLKKAHEKAYAIKLKTESDLLKANAKAEAERVKYNLKNGIAEVVEYVETDEEIAVRVKAVEDERLLVVAADEVIRLEKVERLRRVREEWRGRYDRVKGVLYDVVEGDGDNWFSEGFVEGVLGGVFGMFEEKFEVYSPDNDKKKDKAKDTDEGEVKVEESQDPAVVAEDDEEEEDEEEDEETLTQTFTTLTTLALKTTLTLLRLHHRSQSFTAHTTLLSNEISDRMNLMCISRNTVDNSAVTRLCHRINTSACNCGFNDGIREAFKVGIDLDLDVHSNPSHDAIDVRSIFDCKGSNVVTCRFLRGLVGWFCKSKSRGTGGGGDVSVNTVIKAFAAQTTGSESSESSRGFDGEGYEWTRNSATIQRIFKKLDRGSGSGRIKWKKMIHNLILHTLPVLPTLEGLCDIIHSAKFKFKGEEEGLSSSSSSSSTSSSSLTLLKNGNYGMPVSEFMKLSLWFDSNSNDEDGSLTPAPAPAAAAALREIYKDAFGCFEGKEKGLMIDFTEIMLTFACVPSPLQSKEKSTAEEEEEEEGRISPFESQYFEHGLYNASVIINALSHPSSPSNKYTYTPLSTNLQNSGPIVTSKQLEFMFTVDGVRDGLVLARKMFADAVDFEERVNGRLMVKVRVEDGDEESGSVSGGSVKVKDAIIDDDGGGDGDVEGGSYDAERFVERDGGVKSGSGGGHDRGRGAGSGVKCSVSLSTLLQVLQTSGEDGREGREVKLFRLEQLF